MAENNKFVNWQKSINYKNSLVYFLVIQVMVLVCSFFLLMPIIPLMRFIIKENGLLRDFMESITLILVELLLRFLVFFSFFKNSRSLTFKNISLEYGVTVLLRLVFSLVTSFASWSAGIGICTFGSTLGVAMVDENIKTMQDVPVWLYIIVFVLFEALVYLIAFLAYKIAKRQREKTRRELINNKDEI